MRAEVFHYLFGGANGVLNLYFDLGAFFGRQPFRQPFDIRINLYAVFVSARRIPYRVVRYFHGTGLGRRIARIQSVVFPAERNRRHDPVNGGYDHRRDQQYDSRYFQFHNDFSSSSAAVNSSSAARNGAFFSRSIPSSDSMFSG